MRRLCRKSCVISYLSGRSSGYRAAAVGAGRTPLPGAVGPATGWAGRTGRPARRRDLAGPPPGPRPGLPSELRGLVALRGSGRLSRRSVLRGAGAVGLGALLAACGTPGTGPAPAAAGPTTAAG